MGSGTFARTRDAAHERLILRPLPGDEVMLYFNLTVSTNRDDLRHLDLFPRALAELAIGTGVVDLQLSLSSGRWLSNSWGAQPKPVPQGGSISALFAGNSSWHHSWPALRRALAPLLCASIAEDVPPDMWAEADASEDVVVKRFDARDVSACASSGASDDGSAGEGVFLRKTVPRQNVCTENTAAWLQLWPCSDAAGVTSLLAGGAVAGTTANRLRRARMRALHVKLATEPIASRLCDTDGVTKQGCAGVARRLVLELGYTLVLPSAEGGPQRGGDLLGGLLARGLRACELTSSSRLAIEAAAPDAARLGFASRASDGYGAAEGCGGRLWRRGLGSEDGRVEWRLRRDVALPLLLGWRPDDVGARNLVSWAPFQARRHAMRDDDTRGLMVLELINGASAAARVAFSDRLPGWLALQWHTATVLVDGEPLPVAEALQALRLAPAVPPSTYQVRAVASSIYALELPRTHTPFLLLRSLAPLHNMVAPSLRHPNRRAV